MGMLGILNSPNWQELSEIINTVDAWFDVFNSKVPKIDSRPRKEAFGLEMETQKKILQEMENLVLQLRFGNRVNLLPFQKDILISIKSLNMLFECLKDQFKAEYVLTYRLNQVMLEMFFGVIRAKGGLYDHPSPLELKYCLHSYYVVFIINCN